MKLHFSISYRRISAVVLTAFAVMCGGAPVVPGQHGRTTVAQVTSGVTVSTATDYTITGTTPFTSAGSVNLTGPDAVLILKAVIPSKRPEELSWATCYINGSEGRERLQLHGADLRRGHHRASLHHGTRGA
jgi:hypothetical protein